MTKRLKDIEKESYYFTDTSFNLLMQKRIRKVLVICSSYDFFSLEEDGRIDEQIFNEYVSLSLRYPPVFIHADSARKAFDILSKENIDLIIEMLSISDLDTFELAKQLKAKYNTIPIVVLTHFSREVSIKLDKEDLSAIDHVFSWLGNADLLLAIIKLIEDRMNADFDVEQVGVQAILLVEDSVRFTSSYLPNLYKIVLEQSRDFMKEALNEHQKMLRRRGRPKILLAKNYDDAVTLFNKHKHNILGIISDVSYKAAADKRDTKTKAGLDFCRLVHATDENIPFLLQSSDKTNEKYARELNAGFIHKYSKNLSNELREYVIRNFGFGEFIFRDPDTHEVVGVAENLKALQRHILTIPDNVLIYHTSKDDLSKWLNARALFPIAQIFKPAKLEDFKNLDDVRKYIYKAITNFRSSKARGIIAEFDKTNFDEYLVFSRIGEGSLGGKARGLAFMNTVLKREDMANRFKDVLLTIPPTIVLSTEVFEEFMYDNDLYRIGLSNMSDSEILQHFIEARLPKHIYQDLLAIATFAKNPIAVRSSSKLEDSFFQPFAGIYNTYMVPMTSSNKHSVTLLENAIKSVYASVYFKSSKSYMSATSNLIDEEKMGIILQSICGNRYGNRFYPTISGVARSINFYPISPEKSEDGIVTIAYGLGKLIVDGSVALRFSPKYPKKVLQLSSPDIALKQTQKNFYALDMDPQKFVPSTDDSVNLLKLPIKDAEKDAAFKYVASTFDFENSTIRDGYNYPGKKIITFSHILNHSAFPLAEILDTLLKISEKEMNNPIEIEFAVNLDTPPGEPKIFNFLQVRPIVVNAEKINFKIENIRKEETIVYSEKALGNGRLEKIYDIIYVKPETFNAANSSEIAMEIEKLNEKFIIEKRNYILVGPGRWGSSDPWLGIPIKWSHISAARLIIESGLSNYKIDPSQGTHFFHNLTSFGVGYFTINPYANDGFYNLEYLNSLTVFYESKYLRHIRFPGALRIEIDGKNNRGVIYKPKDKKRK